MSSNPNEQSCPACLKGRVGGGHETEHQFTLTVVLITTLDAAKTSAPYLQI